MPKKDSQKANSEKLTALSTVFIEHQDFLKKFLSRYLFNHQDIDDVVQETYLRGFQVEREREIEQPKAFLFRIAKNLALTKLTKKSNQITDYIADLDDSNVIGSEITVEDEVMAHQQVGIYCEAVASLPEQCRKVFLLRKVHGLSHREIAEQLGLTQSSVEKHLRKGLLKCQAYLDERENYSKVLDQPEHGDSLENLQ